MKKTVKTIIYVKSKLKLITFISFVTFIAFMVAFSVFLNNGQAKEQPQFGIYYVAEGDTLWEIAKHYLPSRTDIRNYIYEIRTTNNLKDANIKIGQRLLIPIR